MVETDPFLKAWNGYLRGALRWEELDALWQTLRRRAEHGWYLYAVGEPVPPTPATSAELLRFIDETDGLLRREHREDYCGIVYADDFDAPSLVKIYDPNNLGVVCGFSDRPPLPGWVISAMPPADVGTLAQPAGRRRWWQRIFGAENAG